VLAFAPREGRLSCQSARRRSRSSSIEAPRSVSPDVRGHRGSLHAERRAARARNGHGSQRDDVGDTLLGARLKDARRFSAYLSRRPDIDRSKIVLWAIRSARPIPVTCCLTESNHLATPRSPQASRSLAHRLAEPRSMNPKCGGSHTPGLGLVPSFSMTAFCISRGRDVPGISKAGDLRTSPPDRAEAGSGSSVVAVATGAEARGK